VGKKSPTIVSLEKIAIALDAAELRGRNEEEKKAVYEFVKQLLWFRDNK
jgi:hypothetical protein